MPAVSLLERPEVGKGPISRSRSLAESGVRAGYVAHCTVCSPSMRRALVQTPTLQKKFFFSLKKQQAVRMHEKTCVSLPKSLPGQFCPRAWLADPLHRNHLGAHENIAAKNSVRTVLRVGVGQGSEVSSIRSGRQWAMFEADETRASILFSNKMVTPRRSNADD